MESESDSKFSETITNGWLASLQHQFVSAIVPARDQPYKYQLAVRGKEYLLSATGPRPRLPPAPTAQFREKSSSAPSCSRSWRRPARASSAPSTSVF